MTNPTPSRARTRPAAGWLLVAAFFPTTLPAQTCFDFGSTPIAANLQAGPPLAPCGTTTGWPAWHLLTPPHRAPAPHLGFAPGDARELPRLLVAYRCTGFLLVPVVPIRVRTMGYVIDQPEHRCPDIVTP